MSQLLVMRTLDDRALVARMLAGDEAAFAALVDRHHASLLGIASAWACRRHAAAVARESWSTMLDQLAEFRFEVPLRAWLMRFAARRAVEYRCRGSSRGRLPIAAVDAFDAGGRWTDPPAAWDEGSAAADAVADALAGLPPLERAVFTLRDVERLGAADARFVLDLGAPSERALLTSARERVRRALDASLRAVAASAPLASTG